MKYCLPACLRPLRPWAGLVALLLLFRGSPDAPALGYLDNEGLAKNLKAAAADHSRRVRLTAVAESLKKNLVWLLELGIGTAEEGRRRPALLLVAGIEGNDLAGCGLARRS